MDKKIFDVSEGYNLEKILEIAKKSKMDWVEKTERGDMPPTLFVERDGKCLAIVVAAEIDRDAGLHAANVCRAGFNADTLTLIMDAHIKEEKATPGTTFEEMSDHFKKTYKRGDFQRACDEEGACERGEISDVLLGYRADVKGGAVMWTMAYSYHGKKGPAFRWMDEHTFSNKMMGDKEGERLGGFIPESLVKIMSSPSLLNRTEKDLELLRKKAAEWNMSEARQLYHTGRACLMMLMSQGYEVLHLEEHPDGEEPEPLEIPKVNVALSDIIPDHIGAEIGSFVREYLSDQNLDAFKMKLILLLNRHNDLIQANAKKMKVPSFLYTPDAICEKIVTLLTKSKRLKLPMKVDVWTGDQKEHLGAGQYVSDVPVYFISMKDGSITSLKNAEEKPTPEMLADMEGELIEIPANPKIILDNGDVVYGCQVWWKVYEEEHQHHEGCNH